MARVASHNIRVIFLNNLPNMNTLYAPYEMRFNNSNDGGTMNHSRWHDISDLIVKWLVNRKALYNVFITWNEPFFSGHHGYVFIHSNRQKLRLRLFVDKKWPCPANKNIISQSSK